MNRQMLLGLAVGFCVGFCIYEWINDGQMVLSVAVGHPEAVRVIQQQPESRGDAVAVNSEE